MAESPAAGPDEARLQAMFARGEFAPARELAAAWCMRAPGEALAHLWLGQAEGELGHLPSAEAAFERAAALAPELLPAWVNLGMVRAQLGRMEEAAWALLEAQPRLASRPADEQARVLSILDGVLDAALGSRVADPRWRALEAAPALPPLPATPRVSVILPTCERPRLLVDAIESVRAQDWPDLQIVVVNDARESVAQHLPRDARLRLVEDGVRRGQAAARNRGVAASDGEVLCFLDDDDLYLPGHVASLVHCLGAAGALFAHADTQPVVEVLDDTGRRVETRGAPFPGMAFSRARLFVQNDFPINTWALRRALFTHLGGFDAALSALEDWDFALRAACCCDFASLPQVVSESRMRSGAADSVSTRHAMAAVLPRIYGRFPDRGDALVAAARLRYAARMGMPR